MLVTNVQKLRNIPALHPLRIEEPDHSALGLILAHQLLEIVGGGGGVGALVGLAHFMFLWFVLCKLVLSLAYIYIIA